MRPSDVVRRAVDVAVAVAGLVALSPVLAVVALATRVSVGPGIIYRQRRLGRGGHPFELVKFRSMRHPEPGRESPAHDAERVTRVGAFLRSTSLDELPSMWNLLRGEITLVGPRPLPVHYWDRFRGAEYERFTVRPGITGLAQVAGRNLVDWSDRLALDVEYARTRTLRGDLAILVRTVPAVLRRAGIAHEGGVTMHVLPPDRPAPDGVGTERGDEADPGARGDREHRDRAGR